MMEAPERLSSRARSFVESGTNSLDLSVLSFAEIAAKSAIGKLRIGRESILEAASRWQLNVLPYLQEHALALFGLPLLHKDPFDRQIIAQALVEGIPIVTCDEQFASYKGMRVIW
jgi:PIN domain nuclease of toxin-antitoxin system